MKFSTICFIKGKIIEEINFQFLYHKKNISISKTILKLRNESIITIKGYDEMADWMVQNIRKEDEVILQGKINTKMEVEVKWMRNNNFPMKKLGRLNLNEYPKQYKS